MKRVSIYTCAGVFFVCLAAFAAGITPDWLETQWIMIGSGSSQPNTLEFSGANGTVKFDNNGTVRFSGDNGTVEFEHSGTVVGDSLFVGVMETLEGEGEPEPVAALSVSGPEEGESIGSASLLARKYNERDISAVVSVTGQAEGGEVLMQNDAGAQMRLDPDGDVVIVIGGS